MAELEPPAYYLDLQDKKNWSRIESVKPGKSVPVWVRTENDSMAEPIKAKGMRSEDGNSFDVVVETAQGEQGGGSWNYNDLKKEKSAYLPD